MTNGLGTWSPASPTLNGTNCNGLTYVAGKDVYHFLVQGKSGNYKVNETVTNPSNGRTSSRDVTYNWTLDADFSRIGAVTVTYDKPVNGVSTETINRQTNNFGLANVQNDHLYVAVPAGAKIVAATLTYDLVSGGSGNVPAGTTLGIHTLSHTCSDALPTISINTATASYSETYTQSYSWTLSKQFDLDEDEKADEVFFDEGIAPRFVVTATRFGPTTDTGSYRLGTATVSGSFEVSTGDEADATITLGDNTCTKSDNNDGNVKTYDYSCSYSPSSVGVGPDVLNTREVTVSGTVTGNPTAATKTAVFATAASSTDRNTYGASATLTDNLAGNGINQIVAGTETDDKNTPDDTSDDTEIPVLADDVDCSGCSTNDNGTEEDTSDDWRVRVSGGRLEASGNGTFTVTYGSGWDWESYDPDEDCTRDYTNTATLTVDGATSPGAVEYSWSTNCPPPTVTLSSLDSSYTITYDKTYPWSITKTAGVQELDGGKIPFTVVATRGEPNIGNVVGSSVTITGNFDTEFAMWGNVTVEATVGSDDPISCATSKVAETTGSFTCIIGADDLPELDEGDIESGWLGSDIDITATVQTAGGTDDDSLQVELDKPDESTATEHFASGSISDDLDGYGATDIVCLSGVDDAETVDNESDCWRGLQNSVSAGPISTNSSTSTITLTYKLDWWSSIDFDENCPTIVNTATVPSGGDTPLATATATVGVVCPTLTMSVDGSPGYTETWDSAYSWTLTKTFDGQDSSSWKPKYTVTATRGATAVEANHKIVEGTQKVDGTITVGLSSSNEGPNDESAIWPIPTAAQIEDLAASLSTPSTTCTLSTDPDPLDGAFPFTCVVETESAVTAQNGLSGTTHGLSSSGKIFNVPTTASAVDQGWGNQTGIQEGEDDQNETATIVDNTGGLGAIGISGGTLNGTTLTSTGTGTVITMTYTGNWQWNSGGGCNQVVTNVATLDGSDDNGIASATTTNTIKCEDAVPGLTIGYWGNPEGGRRASETDPAKGGLKPLWRAAPASGNPEWTWSTVLGNLPNFKSDREVRDYMQKATCSTSDRINKCQTMFRAQALASTLNVLNTGGKFGDQNVWFGFDGKCRNVRELLKEALGSTTIDTDSSTAGVNKRIAYKSIFDDLNNTRAKRCPAA